MVDKSTDYHSFLVRLWKIRRDDTAVWRASLEDPKTGEVLGFENLQALFNYLETLTGDKEDGD